ncbi:MAG TPA: spore cortex biosynthesis protein YabQ [Clostridia bacterium]|nr:spore cortex biosynthesis protein YabQ [Clostridia bacterium]
MDYLPSMADQTQIFFYSLGLGFLLGILYDVFRTVRLAISSAKRLILIQDILYVLICTFVSFLFFMVVNNGQIRGYIILGEAFGWLIYYSSFGIFAIKASAAIIKIIKKTFSLIYKVATTPFILLYRIINRPMLFLYKKIRNISKKVMKNLKLHLKIRCSIMYNLKESVCKNKTKKRTSKKKD